MSSNGFSLSSLIAAACNVSLALQQNRTAKIFDFRGFASFAVCFKNGRGLPLPQRIAVMALRLRLGIRVLVGGDCVA
jgi:hypothetical protein